MTSKDGVVIIGNGIAGTTAARHIRKQSDVLITMISSEATYFFSRPALMYVYMGHIRLQDTEPYESWFWKKNRITLIQDHVLSIDPAQKSVALSSGNSIPYRTLILATGSEPRKLNIPGEDLDGVTGLYSLHDLQYIEVQTQNIKEAVIAGGGLIGIELTEMLYSRGIKVTLLIREERFYDTVLPMEESRMVERHLEELGIEVIPMTEIRFIEGDTLGRIQAIHTQHGDRIECQFAGITIGVRPNIAGLHCPGLAYKSGYLVDQFLQTNLPGIFAIGDCAELRNPDPDRKAIEPVWYTGRMMGETVASTICGNPTEYHPGYWFNSAKFFNIEYQVYGKIDPTISSDPSGVYWEHPEGCRSIRINATHDKVTGFLLMGIRFRKEVCEHWIQDQTPVERVLAQLDAAFFDSEFSARYGHEVRRIYETRTGRSIRPEMMPIQRKRIGMTSAR